MAERKWRIAWRVDATGQEGHGGYCLTKEEAEYWIEDLQSLHSSITYWSEQEPEPQPGLEPTT